MLLILEKNSKTGYKQSMETQNLKAFIAVAEHQSFSKAAEDLFITQPAVSKRIAALEMELDTPLFDRIGRQPQLTEAGRALLPRAKAVLLELDDAQRALNNLTGEISGKLSIGTSHHIGLHRLAPILRAFTTQFPQVQLDIRFLDSEEGCNLVEQGVLELAIVTLPSADYPRLTLTEIWDDPLSLIASQEHPLAKGKSHKTVDELAKYPSILPARGTFTRNIIETAFSSCGHDLQVSMETNYLETIKMMVSIGLGWSALPDIMMDETIFGMKVDGIVLERKLGTVVHKERTLSNAAHALMGILESSTK
jgi:DNA-binding transcriptional LysR family regulator